MHKVLINFVNHEKLKQQIYAMNILKQNEKHSQKTPLFFHSFWNMNKILCICSDILWEQQEKN